MEKTFKNYLLYTLLGFASASIMTILSHARLTYIAPYIFIASFVFLFSLAFDENKTKGLIISSLVGAFIITFPFLSMNFGASFDGHNPMNVRYIEFIFFSLPSFAFMVHCFHYAYHKTDCYKLDYRYLFEAVWNTIPMLFVAGLFANITNALISSASMGFKTINSHFIETYYTSNVDVLFILNSTFFFVGLSIAKIHDKITLNLRFVLLRMLNFLLPLLIITTFTYTVMFCLFHGSNLFTTQVISGSSILASLALLGIIFFNAYYQDGEDKAPLPMAISIIFKVYRLLLFVMATYSAIQLFVTYSPHIPANIELYVLLLMLFPLVYAIGVFFHSNLERTIITNGNMLIALLYLIALVVLYHPFQSYERPFIFTKETLTIQSSSAPSMKANSNVNKKIEKTQPSSIP